MLACKPCLFAFFALSLCCTLFAAEPAPPPPVDPMLWKEPTAAPKPREVLKPEDLAKKLARAKMLQKQEDDYVNAMPKDAGMHFLFVDQNGPEYKDGLTSGDIILKLDGQPVHTYEDYTKLRHNDQIQAFTVLSRRNGTQVKEVTVKVRAGFEEMVSPLRPFEPTLDYCEWPKDPRWNEFAEPAFRLYNISPEVCETLLYKAEKAGFPDGFAKNALMGGLAIREGRYAEALDAAWLAVKEKPSFVRSQYAFFQAATASFKLEAALKFAEEHKLPMEDREFRMARLKMMVEEWQKQTADRKLVKSPLDALGDYRWQSWLVKAKRPDDAQLPPHRYERFQTNRVQGMGVPAGHFTMTSFPLPPLAGQNFYIHATFNYARSSQVECSYIPNFTLGMFDNDPKNEERLQHAEQGGSFTGIRLLSRCPRGRGAVSHAVNVMHHDEVLKSGVELEERLNTRDDEETPTHDFKMAQIEGRIEMRLDGKRIFYGPGGNDSHTWTLCIHAVGDQYAMHHLQAWELLSEEDYKKVVKPDVDKVYAAGFTELHDAVRYGFTAGDIKLLLDLGADPNKTDRFGQSAVHLALRNDEDEVTKLLLDRGGKVDPWVQATKGDIPAIKQVLAKDPGILQLKKPFPLLHAAVKSKNLELVKTILDAGADVNLRDDFHGEIPLCWAAVNEDIPIIELLVARGANPKITDSRGVTVLQYTLEEKTMKILKDAAAKAPPPPPRQRPQQVEPPKETKPTKPVQPPEEF